LCIAQTLNLAAAHRVELRAAQAPNLFGFKALQLAAAERCHHIGRQGVELVGRQGPHVACVQRSRVFRGEGRQLCGGQVGQLAAGDGLQFVLVISQQAIPEVRGIESADLFSAQLHKIGCFDGTDLGTGQLADLAGGEFLDLAGRERSDIGRGKARNAELTDLAGRI